MFKHGSVAAIFLAAALSFPLYSAAQNQTGGAIYGSQLMTQQERARERGVTLPGAPPARGARGAGPGGPGMGPGAGMGGPGER